MPGPGEDQLSALPGDVELVEVSFEGVQDPDERAFLGDIETSFRLSDEKVDRLISAGREVLRNSPGFQRALVGMRAMVQQE